MKLSKFWSQKQELKVDKLKNNNKKTNLEAYISN